MNSDRIKEVQEQTAFPESLSVKQALLQVWNECQQEHNKQLRLHGVMHWVACKDDKPSDDWVFCWMPSQNTFTKGYLLNEKWHLQDFADNIKVSHWMPMLKPPCA